jgi:hypothetical protein
MATTPIDFIRDQEREMLRRQTMGMTPGTTLQQGMMGQEARTGAALANMFATQQKMAMAEDAELYRQQVMDQRRQQQEAALQARAFEAQQGREFRSLEGQKVRDAAMERLDKQQQFQRAMQRRRLGAGGGRKQRNIDKLHLAFRQEAARPEQAAGSFAQKEKALRLIIKRMDKLDKSAANILRDSLKGHAQRGTPYPTMYRQEQAGRRAQERQARGSVEEARKSYSEARRTAKQYLDAQAKISPLQDETINRELKRWQEREQTEWERYEAAQAGAAPIVRTQAPAAPKVQLNQSFPAADHIKKRLVAQGVSVGGTFPVPTGEVYRWDGDTITRIK